MVPAFALNRLIVFPKSKSLTALMLDSKDLGFWHQCSLDESGTPFLWNLSQTLIEH